MCSFALAGGGVVSAIATIRKNGKEYYTTRCQERANDFFDKNERFAEYLELYMYSLGKMAGSIKLNVEG